MQQASLEQLNDIVEPGAASFWPPAWPVIVISIILLALVLGLLWWLHARYRIRRPQRLALAKLRQLQQPSASDVTLLCKRVALAYYPRQQIAALSGEDWLRFMGANAQQHNDLLQQCDALFYKPAQGELISRYQQFAEQWIRHAHRHARQARKGGRHV
ncbi:DUF4381 domain-containing protein [Idiomarina aquatica]|uniref:DUF4381 domain-containing protein n=1 Tax=Idiomarina aquatica TaxID=1327752 RepID=A0AA94JDJ4_9GAMM|nr:DUF4381 domain-containing protein [Idiomarina aquatica]RUO44867.1 hypothetical protein CWE23_02200 [Idiomarina aquatica]